jgi:MFS family permease
MATTITPINTNNHEPNSIPNHHHNSSHVDPGEIAVGVIIGRASEYFDFFVYAIASVVVFPAVFFPHHDSLTAMLYSFVIFSFAFIARPVGTAMLMRVQRQFGRETKLTIALFLMGISTAGMAFLPGYQSAGVAAIVLLAILRIGQGLAMGGSWDGLPSLLALNAPSHKRGWYAMMGQLGAPIGFLVAAGLFAYLLAALNPEDFLSWGWRYPFYVAFAINVVALFARLRLVSSNEYARLLEERVLQPVPMREMVASQGYNIAVGALAALASYALFHVVTVFPLSWISMYSGRNISEFLVIQMMGAILGGMGVVASGLIADRLGRRNTLGSFAIMIGVFSGFVPMLLDGGETGQTVFVMVGFLLLGLSYGQAAGAVTANFKAQYRYTGAALTLSLIHI